MKRSPATTNLTSLTEDQEDSSYAYGTMSGAQDQQYSGNYATSYQTYATGFTQESACFGMAGSMPQSYDQSYAYY